MNNHNTFASQVIAFNSGLHFTGTLPPDIRIMNPFREQAPVMEIMRQFYQQFYNDQHTRQFIIGINPGRLGSGTTGIPFTDTKRLVEVCGISIEGITTHEPSSVFIYDVIHAYGGPHPFFRDFYIGSISPLGFTAVRPDGSEVNYNYYDSKPLTEAVYDFMIASIREQLTFGIDRRVCYCLGTGKNVSFLQQVNKKEHFFDKIVPLEHPRFVMQYRAKQRQAYVNKYLQAFADNQPN